MHKVGDADLSLEGYIQEKHILLPHLHAAMETERSWKRHVEQERREYLEAKARCEIEEEVIERLQEELVVLREESQTAFDKVLCLLIMQLNFNVMVAEC